MVVRFVGGRIGVVVIAGDRAVGIGGAGAKEEFPLGVFHGQVEPGPAGGKGGGKLVPRLDANGDSEGKARARQAGLLHFHRGRARLKLLQGLLDLPREVIAGGGDIERLARGPQHAEDIDVAADKEMLAKGAARRAAPRGGEPDGALCGEHVAVLAAFVSG